MSELLTYLEAVAADLRRGDATEHTHRPTLKSLLEALAPSVTVVNEPRRIACGAPDLAVVRRADGLVLGHVEAKDVGVPLDDAVKSEQIRKRYLPALPNLLVTDYLEFRWFVDGAERDRVRLASLRAEGILTPDHNALARAAHLLREFLSRDPIRLTGADELARRLARLTHLIREAITAAFQTGQASELLRDWRETFARTLLPELADPGREGEFADMFAQTLAYGLFSARVMSGVSAQFTVAEAAKLIPRTNPFLRDFFDLITGPKLEDEPFAGYVRDLVTVLAAADMAAILEDFGKGRGPGRRHDPVVHFYETFLAAYDPELRELRGVYYTPEPVVSYIVESVDWLLRERFGLKDGLADKSRLPVALAADSQGGGEPSHRVLILDPAAGTGTFLFEVIEHIREQFERKHQAGLWPAYVHEHLLPRLFGFELMMAPYAVAHFKLGLELGQARHLMELQRARWSYTFQPGERLNIYLTNTLEDIEHVAQQLGPLAILSREANEATALKKHRPVLVVLGNPPYSNYGRQNRNDFILGLLADYKRGLGEKKLNLDDDFIRFIRWAQWRIERTGQGIIGFITNNVYLDGLTHRRMRQSLLESFDEIYVLNLHGSAKKQETAPDGSKDENVFDITVGVAIVLLVKRPGAKPAGRGKAGKAKKLLATVHRADLWGLRKHKYDWLNRHNITNTEWIAFTPDPPDFFFHPRNARHEQEWNHAWSIRKAFVLSGNGVKTERDCVSIQFSREEIKRVILDFRQLDERELRWKYDLGDDSRDWQVLRAKADVAAHCADNPYTVILYRPFDFRHTWYSGTSKGFIGTPAAALMRHFLAGENLGLITTRQTKEEFGVFATTVIAGHKSCAAYDINTVFPLYLYPNGEEAAQAELVPVENGRRPNLAAAFIAEFEAKLGLKFVPDGRGNLRKTFGPEDVFHYAYAIFHAPGYRARYAEFLKLDFPRVPVTSQLALFRKLCARGERLVGLHTLKLTVEEDVAFDVPGSNVVEQVVYVPPKADVTRARKRVAQPDLDGTVPAPPKGYEAGPSGRVYINRSQYFDGVAPVVWQSRIGGYQVAKKWLTDRLGRTLTHDDIEHYQRTLGALAETRVEMALIDTLINDQGGWPLR
jgi:hypothetical protein